MIHYYKHMQLLLLLLPLLLLPSVHPKVLAVKAKGVILQKKGTPLYEHDFTTLDIKVSNDKIQVAHEAQNGIPDENPLLFGLRECRLVYNQLFVKWSLFSKIMDYKDKDRLYYFPYEQEMKEIKMSPNSLVLCHHRPELPGGCEYILLDGKDHSDDLRGIAYDNYLEAMTNAQEHEYSDLPDNIKLEVLMMGKENKFAPQEVNLFNQAMVFYTSAKDIGSQQVGLRYNKIKKCQVAVTPVLPDSIKLPN